MIKIITSRTNEKIKLVKKLVSSSKERRKKKMFVIEGLRLCSDASISNVKILYTFYSASVMHKHDTKVKSILEKSLNCYQIDETIEKNISDTSTPQGIFCVASIEDNIPWNTSQKSKLVALENIQDPLNLGTILRSAEALGIDGVIMSKDCVDIYSPKVLRGSMGAVFRVPFKIVNDIAETVKEMSKLGVRTYATLPDNSLPSITEVNFKSKSLVVIGNEGNGISKKTLEFCKNKITIPMKGMAESLNAATAASIVMWEIMK